MGKSGGPAARPTVPVGVVLSDAERAELMTRLEGTQATPLETLQASGRAIVEADDLKGRRIVNAALIAEPPRQALRFRADGHGPIGQLFQLIQSAETLSVYLPSEGGQLFVGPVNTLHESAGLLKKLQPMRILQAVTVHDAMLRHAGEGTWRRIDQLYVALEAPVDWPGIDAAEFVMNAETLELSRVRLIGRDRSSAAIDEALVVYGAWETIDGVLLPTRLTVTIPRERATIQLEGLKYKVNPTLRPRSFDLPRAAATYPLSQLAFVDPSPDQSD